MYVYIILDYGSQDATIDMDLKLRGRTMTAKRSKQVDSASVCIFLKARCVSEAERTRYQTSHRSHRNRWRTMDFGNLKSGSLMV